MRRVRTGVLILALAAAAFATMSTLVKLAYSESATVLFVLVLRYAIAAGVYMPIAFVLVNPTSVPARSGSWFAMSALYALGVGTFYLALKIENVSQVAPIVYLYPAMVILIERFAYGEVLRFRALSAVAMGAAGSILVLGVGFGRPTTLLGGALALVSAVANALQYVVAAHKIRPGDQLATATSMVFVSAVTFALIGLFVGVPAPTVRGWIYVLVATALGLILPYAFLQGLSRVGASRAVMMSALEPALIVVLALAVLHETVGLLQAIGIALILGGFVVAATWLSKDESAGPA